MINNIFIYLNVYILQKKNYNTNIQVFLNINVSYIKSKSNKNCTGNVVVICLEWIA